MIRAEAETCLMMRIDIQRLLLHLMIVSKLVHTKVQATPTTKIQDCHCILVNILGEIPNQLVNERIIVKVWNLFFVAIVYGVCKTTPKVSPEKHPDIGASAEEFYQTDYTIWRGWTGLGLPSLLAMRERKNMIDTYKIISGKVDVQSLHPVPGLPMGISA